METGADGARSKLGLLMRAAVEVQLWVESDVFIGSRSSMSEVAYLMRASARGVGRLCALPLQPCFEGTNCNLNIDGVRIDAEACESDERYYAATKAARLFCVSGQPPPVSNRSRGGGVGSLLVR